jgi:hypothetical protein
MAAHGVVQCLSVVAQNIDAYNRMFIDESNDVDNGTVFQCSTPSTTAGEDQVYTIATPASSAGLQNLWMACSPIDTIVTDAQGNQYKLGLTDPRNFTNVAGIPFDGYKPQIGDRIALTDACLGGTKSTGDYVVATASTRQLTWAAAAASGLSYLLRDTTYISIPDGSIGSQRVTAYLFECVAIA